MLPRLGGVHSVDKERLKLFDVRADGEDGTGLRLERLLGAVPDCLERAHELDVDSLKLGRILPSNSSALDVAREEECLRVDVEARRDVSCVDGKPQDLRRAALATLLVPLAHPLEHSLHLALEHVSGGALLGLVLGVLLVERGARGDELTLAVCPQHLERRHAALLAAGQRVGGLRILAPAVSVPE